MGMDLAQIDRRLAEHERTMAQPENASGMAAVDLSGTSDREPPVFPLDVLPPAVSAYVAACAESLNVPAEMVAGPLLAMAGALIGNRLYLAPKGSWREYSALFVAVVAPPGSAKTPALRLAQWPLDALQRGAHELYRLEKIEHEDALAAWKAGGQDDGEPKPQPPRLRHYFTSDPTLEALAGMLAGTSGVALIRDELSGWVAAMNQYRGGAGADRQAYLSLWASAALKVDRVNRDPLYVANPVVGVVGTIQPDLAGVLHDASRRRDGFVERLLPVVVDAPPARWTDAEPTTEQYRDVLDLFELLDMLPKHGADPERPHGLGVPLSPAAKALFITWHDQNATLIGQADGLAAGFFSKLPAHVARLALILHALWHADKADQPLAAEHMADAIELAEFFRLHIARFLALLAASAPAGSAGLDGRILRIFRRSEPRFDDRWVPRSVILDGLRNVPAGELTDALVGMAESGRIESRLLPGRTKPTECWRMVLAPERFGPFGHSDYSDFPREVPSNSEYSETPNRPNPRIRAIPRTNGVARPQPLPGSGYGIAAGGTEEIL